jgi:drug/metabolite transporter (DMT)-like permease
MSAALPPAAPPRGDSAAAGIAMFLAALVAFACYDAFAKQMVASYAPAVVNLGRYTAIGALAFVLLLRHGDLRLWRQPHQKLLTLRSVALAIVATCFMTALVTMPLAEATAIYFTAPLMMVALSPWLLGERVGRAQWAAVLLGFAGMLCIVRPGNSLPLMGTLLMAVSAVCYALFQVLTRRLSGLVPAPVQFAHMALACLVVTNLPVLFMPDLTLPPWPEMALLIAGGVLSGGAQLLLLAAFRRVAAATLAPLNYVQLLLAVLISTVWFQRPPDAPALAGMALIAIAGIYLARARRTA